MTKKVTTKTLDPTPVKEVHPVIPANDELRPSDQKEVRVIERIIENREIAPQDAFGKLSRPQIELIKRTVARGASDDELRMFIQVCKGANLNPFLKQVHLIPRWDSKEERNVRAIQVSIDGFRAIAESSGQYAGNEDAIFEGEAEIEFVKDEKNKQKVMVPNQAKVTVYKLVEGQRYPFTATARWTEYYPGSKMGFQWHIRPYLMLGKCAEALALRKAFPKLLSGMYAQEEMDRGQGENNEGERMQHAFTALKNAIAKASADDCDELWGKLEKSDKYTPAQKAEVKKMIDERKITFGKELDKQNANPTPVS